MSTERQDKGRLSEHIIPQLHATMESMQERAKELQTEQDAYDEAVESYDPDGDEPEPDEVNNEEAIGDLEADIADIEEALERLENMNIMGIQA